VLNSGDRLGSAFSNYPVLSTWMAEAPVGAFSVSRTCSTETPLSAKFPFISFMNYKHQDHCVEHFSMHGREQDALPKESVGLIFVIMAVLFPRMPASATLRTHGAIRGLRTHGTEGTRGRGPAITA
jgi:hypothetical protein